MKYSIRYNCAWETESGFTLVEVIIAIVLLLGVTLASMSYFYLGTGLHVDAKKYEYALQLGEDKLEEWRSQVPLEDDKVEEQFHRYGTQFTRYFVASTPEPPELDPETYERYQVLITSVVWTADGEEKKVGLKSIVHPYRQK